MWLLRIKAGSYHFFFETQEAIDIWPDAFVLGQLENTKHKLCFAETKHLLTHTNLQFYNSAIAKIRKSLHMSLKCTLKIYFV